MLGVPSGLTPQFGFRPGIPLRNGRTDHTEIDMRLGDLMVESKLTETDFQTASVKMIERYRDLDEVFDPGELMMSSTVRNYQLIRGVLAASATGASFCVLCDARRPDLIENWYSSGGEIRYHPLNRLFALFPCAKLRDLPDEFPCSPTTISKPLSY
jgi:hypothetical protein